MKMKIRILVGAGLIMFLLVVLYFGGIVYLAATSLFSFCAVYEMAHITANRGYRPLSLPAYIFAVSFPFVYHLSGEAQSGFITMMIFYLFCILLSMIGIVLRRAAEPENALVTLLLFVYPLALLICMMLVYTNYERHVGLTAAALTFGGAACTDTFAYFIGVLFGKHKLCERISPKKTVEGSIGGLIGGIAFGAALIPLQAVWGGVVSAPILLTVGFCVGIVAQFGDLFASILKRWAGVKDFSSVFPEHGGIMDRIDSIIISAPVVLSVFTIFGIAGIY